MNIEYWNKQLFADANMYRTMFSFSSHNEHDTDRVQSKCSINETKKQMLQR